MNVLLKMKTGLKKLFLAVSRYELTTVFLLLMAFFIADSIETDNDNTKLIFAMVFGAFAGMMGNSIRERFIKNKFYFYLMDLVIVAITVLYYTSFNIFSEGNLILLVKTSVFSFAFFLIFMLAPVYKREFYFNKSFLIVFKSFFNSFLYALVMFLGMTLIYRALDLLLITIDEKVFMHTANIIFVLFMPLYFLSRIPEYKSVEIKTINEDIIKASKYPDFLRVLLSYIIIPLSAVYTLILVIYILSNIGGDFFSNNLLEPLLVSYSIAVILIYLLSFDLDNKVVNLYKKIMPKLMIPIIICQIAASVLLIFDKGVTHGRYYVILFGITAMLSGIVMSFKTKKDNNYIGLLFIIAAIISVIPPIDAFLVSKNNQINNLREILVKNDMIKNDEIIKKDNISNEDKKKIILFSEYIYDMEYAKDVEFLPERFNYYSDFEKVFGFNQYDGVIKDMENIFAFYNMDELLDIEGYDYIIKININPENKDITIDDLNINGKKLLLKVEDSSLNIYEDNKKIADFNLDNVIDKLSKTDISKEMLSKENAEFNIKAEDFNFKIILQEFNLNRSDGFENLYMSFYLFIDKK